MLQFDPNNKKPKTFEWATYIPDRTTQPKFKPHTTRAHALSAFAYKSEGIVYHWDDEEWVEVWRTEKHTSMIGSCYICGKNLLRHGTRYNGTEYTWVEGTNAWINKDKFFPDRVRICWSIACRKACK